jgi:hypothetical protein
VLYYAVNDTRTYGTYVIEEICLTPSDVYKIITRTNQGYKLFFIKNVKPRSFELSVCQDFSRSKAELTSKDESYCDKFNTMNWYYENDANRVFLPIGGNVLTASEKRKLDDKTANNNNASYDTVVAVNQFSNFNRVLSRQAISQMLSKSGITAPFTTSAQFNDARADHPFQRGYLNVNITARPSRIYTADCSRTFYSIDETKKLESPLVVCRLDLSRSGLTKIPEELLAFKNMQALNLGTVSIPESEIRRLQLTLKNCKITYQIKRDPNQSCDTVYSYIGGGRGNILFNGKIYINTALKKKGINLSLEERNPKAGIFRISKGKCPPQTVSIYTQETKTITLCDNTKVILTLLAWENNTGNVYNEEAIFNAVICEPQTTESRRAESRY